MKDFIGFLSKDWQEIPQNYRLLLIAGSFFIFNAWLVDHWTSKDQFLGSILSLWSYYSGLVLIIVGLILLVIKQFWGFLKILYYRSKFRVSKSGRDYFIINFGDPWYLFDKKDKKYYHIEPYGTVQDLRFEGLNIVAQSAFGINIGVQVKKNVWLYVNKYQYAGKINTRN
jgi:hypothetical protein